MDNVDPETLTSITNNEGVDSAVAAARRVVASLLHAGDGTQAEMVEVARRLNDVADYLDEHAPGFHQRMVDMWRGEGTTRHDPVTGPENAIAPPVRLTGNSDGTVSGLVTLGLPYQGPPGYVHGGVSALILDHTLGVANHWGGRSGMTAELTLRYLRPTPLFEPLGIVGEQTTVDGRKIWSKARISRPNGEVCVVADGFFIGKHLPRPR